MLTINRKIILFDLFIFIIFICQFRLAKRQGYILLILEMGIGCLYWLWSEKKFKRFSRFVSIYLFFIVYRIIWSLIKSGGAVDNIKAILYKELGMLLLCHLLVKGCSRISVIRRIRDFGLITSLLGCYEFITHSSIFMRYITAESRIVMQALSVSATRVQTIFMHPIICAVFTMVSWLCVLYLPYKRQWLNYLAKIAIFVCLIGTQSRSSWLAFLIVNIIFVWENCNSKDMYFKRKNIYQFGIIIILTLIIALVFYEYTSNIWQIILGRIKSGMDSNSAGNYNRVTMIKMGIQEWLNFGGVEKLFGSGNGYAYKFLMNHPIRGWNRAVDNQYITVLLDFGLIGLFILLSLLGYILREITHSKDNISKLCGLSLLSMFISCFFYEMFSWITVTLPFCLFLSMMDKDINEEKYTT